MTPVTEACVRGTLADLWCITHGARYPDDTKRCAGAPGMKLSQTLCALASMSADEAHYWGKEVIAQYGLRTYLVYRDLTEIPRGLRRVLKTVWCALWIADDLGGAR